MRYRLGLGRFGNAESLQKRTAIHFVPQPAERWQIGCDQDATLPSVSLVHYRVADLPDWGENHGQTERHRQV
jgi:hypothetical protein